MSKLLTAAVTIAVFANGYAPAQERTGLTEKQIRKIVKDEIRKAAKAKEAKKKQGGAKKDPTPTLFRYQGIQLQGTRVPGTGLPRTGGGGRTDLFYDGGATDTPLRSAKTDVLILRAGEKGLHYYLTQPQAGAEKKPAKKQVKRLPPPAKIHN
jgi:hypothetical protein